MLSPECVKDLNFLMNHLNKIGYQYKSNSCDFKADGEKGIAVFLQWEEIERYEYSDKVKDYLVDNHGQTTYISLSEPSHKGPTIETLTDLIKLEDETVKIIDTFILSATNRKSETIKSFLIELRQLCQHQYNEVSEIITNIEKILSDPGSMITYNQFLKQKFSIEKYSE